MVFAGRGALKITDFMTFLFFDTETTGLPRNYQAPTTNLDNWGAARLVQLSYILETTEGGPRRVLAKGNFIVKPEGFVIPEGASQVHGISTERALAEGLDCKKVVYMFLGAARLADVLVGHNVTYDTHVVGSELVRHWGKDYIDGMKTADTMLASVDFCAIPSARGYKWPKLMELYQKLFGKEFENAHDSSADISATRLCFWELVNKGIITL